MMNFHYEFPMPLFVAYTGEIADWCATNLSGPCRVKITYGSVVCDFAKQIDAVHFQIRWFAR